VFTIIPVDLGYSTIGAADLTFADAGTLAAKYSLSFLELRSLEGTMDLPSYFDRISYTLNAEIPIRVLSTSLRLLNYQEGDDETLIRYAETAKKLNAPYLRIFGGGEWGMDLDDSDFARAANVFDRWKHILESRESRAELLLETHSAFSSSSSVQRLMDAANCHIGILWDSHHTWRLANEPLEQTWDCLGPSIKHIHYKDSLGDSQNSNGFHYVLPGAGDFPFKDLFSLLEDANYSAGVSLEWEKLWHPELGSIEDAIPRFIEEAKALR
jgi:sugar phosphate isomerase/epimerase